jgi:hypothetical protein
MEPEFTLRAGKTGRPRGHELADTAWPLVALSRWTVAVASTQSAAVDEMAFRLVGTSVDD